MARLSFLVCLLMASGAHAQDCMDTCLSHDANTDPVCQDCCCNGDCVANIMLPDDSCDMDIDEDAIDEDIDEDQGDDSASLLQLGASSVGECSVLDVQKLDAQMKKVQDKSGGHQGAHPRALFDIPSHHGHYASLLQSNTAVPGLLPECQAEKMYDSDNKVISRGQLACFMASGSNSGVAACLVEDALWREKHCKSKCQGQGFFSVDCAQCPMEHAEALTVCQSTSNGIGEKCGHCWAKAQLWQANHCMEPCRNYQFTGEGMEKCDECNQKATDNTLGCQGKSLSHMEITVWNAASRKYDLAAKEAMRKAREAAEQEDK